MPTSPDFIVIKTYDQKNARKSAVIITKVIIVGKFRVISDSDELLIGYSGIMWFYIINQPTGYLYFKYRTLTLINIFNKLFLS